MSNLIARFSDEDSMRIDVGREVGESCITFSAGEKLFTRIHPKLEQKEPVELDFSQAKVFASPFFNAAIGRLLQTISPETLNKDLSVRHLSPAGTAVLRRVIENSKSYYANPRAHELLEEIVQDVVDSDAS